MVKALLAVSVQIGRLFSGHKLFSGVPLAVEQFGITLVSRAELQPMPEELGGSLPLWSGEAGYLRLQCCI